MGLSEIVSLGNDEFLVVERDNQAGEDASIKRIYRFATTELTPLPESETPNFPVVEKQLVRDLLPDLLADNGVVIEKVEGLAILSGGEAIAVTDNDGVDDSTGETQLLRLGQLDGF